MMMDAAQRARIEDVFDRALEVPASARADWLDAECARDASLRAQVVALLHAHEVAERVFDGNGRGRAAPGAAAPAVVTASDAREGRRIGPYRVVSELGRGGMGVVYLAERDDGHFRRRVAIKLLRASPDGDELHRRFRAERQILASLDHPNIAQLLDGGVTDGELPYLVMEYVEGQPITTYCDQHRLDVTQRLALFRDVCAAVDHAHRNLVIHRDLKPNNILVTPAGQVKLLDFGIAKLLNPVASAEPAPVTRTQFRVMTPEYASPEQLRGDSLTTASDVYALGVVLYELLAGAGPYRLTAAGPAEIVRAICEQDPVPPSGLAWRGDEAIARAQARGSTPERLRRRLRDDLDAIVMMALRKEPGRRYGSADLLAADIRRHLEREPVLAHRGTRRYRLGKFLRRNRLEAAAAVLVVLSLAGGTLAAVRQARIAGVERDRATIASRDAEAVTSFLVGLFEGGDPLQAQGLSLTAGDLLQRGTARADSLAGEPAVQARTLAAIGEVYESLGAFEDAQVHLDRALQITRAYYGAEHIEVANALNRLGLLARRRGEMARAQQLHGEALVLQRRLLGESHPAIAQTLSDLGWVTVSDPRLQEQRYREALAMRRATLGPDHELVGNSLLAVGGALRRRGLLTEAEQYFREALALRERRFGTSDPRTAEAMVHLGDLLGIRMQRYDEAERLYRRALAIQRQRLGDRNHQLVHGLQSLAALLLDRHENAEAVALIEEALAIRRAVFGDDHYAVAGSIAMLATAMHRQGRLVEAESLQREVLERYRRTIGSAHPYYAGALSSYGAILTSMGRYAEAEQVLRESLAVREMIDGPGSPIIGVSLALLADLDRRRGRFAESERAFQRALDQLHAHYSDDHAHVRAVNYRLALLYQAAGRTEEAERYRALARNDSVPRWPNLP